MLLLFDASFKLQPIAADLFSYYLIIYTNVYSCSVKRNIASTLIKRLKRGLKVIST